MNKGKHPTKELMQENYYLPSIITTDIFKAIYLPYLPKNGESFWERHTALINIDYTSIKNVDADIVLDESDGIIVLELCHGSYIIILYHSFYHIHRIGERLGHDSLNC